MGHPLDTITETIEIDLPVRTVYDQWTQFETFPEFMDEVEEIEQLSDAELAWTTSIAGKQDAFRTRIVEQRPDEEISWTTTRGDVEHSGRVEFTVLDDERTRVAVEMEHEPKGGLEKLGSMLGLDDRAVRTDLENFKSYIEDRGAATGAWRGTIHNGAVTTVDADNPRTFTTTTFSAPVS